MNRPQIQPVDSQGYDPPFWVQVTAVDAAGMYTWVEQQDSEEGFDDMEGGRFGSPSANPVIDPNDATIPIGSIVRVVKSYLDHLLDWVYRPTYGGSGTGGVVMFANCTILADVVTVEENDHIPVVTMLTPAPDWSALFAFDVDFGYKENFTWAGSFGTNPDTWVEDDANRTSHSMVLKTASGTAPSLRFGAIVTGTITPADPDPDDPLNPVDPVTPTVQTTCCDDPVPNTLCAQFGVMTSDDPAFEDLYSFIQGQQVVLGLTFFTDTQAYWFGYVQFDADHTHDYSVGLLCADGTLTLGFGGSISLVPFVQATFTTDTPTVCGVGFTIEGDLEGVRDGDDFAIAFVITPAPCLAPPTVTFNSDDIDLTDLETGDTFTIAGTQFDSGTPANNLVTLDLGATGHVTAATSTLLTVEVDTAPSGAGALTAIVVNGNGTSAPAVQVATVTNLPVADWYDTFADVDGTLITAHTPEIGTSYADWDGTLKITGNKLVSDTQVTGYETPCSSTVFDPGTVHNTLTMTFVLDQATGSSNVFGIIRFNPAGGGSGWMWFVKTDAMHVYQISGGVAGLVDIVSFSSPLSTDTPYTMVIEDDGSAMIGRADGRASGVITSSIGNTDTQCVIGVGAPAGVDNSSIDDLIVEGT